MTVDFDQQRARMINKQLRARGIRDSRALAAMSVVPREEFVPEELRADAYGDCAEPIGSGQTISQPFTVAYMVQGAELSGTEKVLEVGTGSGYGAAVLSLLCAEIHSIDRIPALATSAAARLKRLGYSNVVVHLGDGSLGLAAESPFDAIVVTASSPNLPPAYADQLSEGGRIVIPIGGSETSQHLYRFRRTRNGLLREDLGRFVFVPLIGERGWPPRSDRG